MSGGVGGLGRAISPPIPHATRRTTPATTRPSSRSTEICPARTACSSRIAGAPLVRSRRLAVRRDERRRGGSRPAHGDDMPPCAIGVDEDDYGTTTVLVSEPVSPLPSFTVSVMSYVPETAQVFVAVDPTCTSLLPLPQVHA